MQLDILDYMSFVVLGIYHNGFRLAHCGARSLPAE